MPKISAPSLAEHRLRQRNALVAAAHELLLEGGVQALSFAAVAERAELARPSVYGYFKSKDDIIAAVCEATLPPFLAKITDAVQREDAPRDRVAAYVRSQLEAVANGDHRLAQIVAETQLDASTRERIAALHDSLSPNIADTVESFGTVPGRLGAALIQGVVEAGVRSIEAGSDPETVITASVRIVLNGLQSSNPGS